MLDNVHISERVPACRVLGENTDELLECLKELLRVERQWGLDLMRYLVRLVTPPGGTVLDPFNGSGSTGKACMLEGFDYIGCELDPAYIEISRARIEHAIALRASGLQALKPASERDAHTVDLFAGAA